MAALPDVPGGGRTETRVFAGVSRPGVLSSPLFSGPVNHVRIGVMG
jgi:hypothetical protein